MAGKTDQEWQDILRGINVEVNRFTYRWIPANVNEKISIKSYGDCRSFTYEKLERMFAEEFPAERMGFASCQTETGEAHAVLLVQFGKELWCADNRNQWVHDYRRTPYNWDWIPKHLMALIN